MRQTAYQKLSSRRVEWMTSGEGRVEKGVKIQFAFDKTGPCAWIGGALYTSYNGARVSDAPRLATSDHFVFFCVPFFPNPSTSLFSLRAQCKNE